MNRARFLSISLALFAFGFSQTVQITGRVLEKAAMAPVPGATVRLKGFNLVATTDTGGRFTLSGNPVSLSPRKLEWKTQLLERGLLRVHALASNTKIEATLYDTQGRKFAKTAYRLESAGLYDLNVLQNAPSDFVGFLQVRAGDETYQFKVFRHGGPSSYAEAKFLSGDRPLALQAAVGDSVQVFMTGLITKAVSAPSNGDLGDIVMDYPPRTTIGLGATRPYGTIVLFDGTHGPGVANQEMQAKWRDWPRFTPSVIRFVIDKDPQFPTDTNRVTMRACCAATGTTWGYDDIQALPQYAHADAQLHVEWIAMGQYSASDPLNPDIGAYSASGSSSNSWWVNSGVYVQSRHEVQLQSNPLPPTTIPANQTHYLGSIVNEFAPSSNQNKDNGQWQVYDITFRTGRYRASNHNGPGDTLPAISVWWNGVQTHLNRRIVGAAAGTANHSGENMNDTLYGLKLQFEAGDVRYRNVWMKKLRIDSTAGNGANTNFGY
jgi:hypothetical protein